MGFFESLATGIRAVGGAARVIGEATGDKDAAEAGAALEGLAGEVPEAREALRENLPGVLGRVGEAAGERIFSFLDRDVPASPSESTPPRRSPFGRS